MNSYLLQDKQIIYFFSSYFFWFFQFYCNVIDIQHGVSLGFPYGSAGKESTCNGRPGFDSWVGKFPWRRERLPTPVFCPEEFHGLYSPWGHKELDTLSDFHFHCVNLKYSTWWFDFHTSWNYYHNKFSEYPSCYIDTK